MKKVIIIGAGPAGLTAGYMLLKQSSNYDVTILEASNTVGGISKTFSYKENRMDIGGHRFFSKDPQIMNLWKEIMPLQGSPSYDDKKLELKKPFLINGPDPEVEDNVMLIRNRTSRIYYAKKFYDYPISIKWQTFANMGPYSTAKAAFSYMKSTIHKRKETNLAEFYINRFGKSLYQMFFEDYTEKVWGRNPSEIDPSWGAQRAKGLSVKAIIKDSCAKVLHISQEKETSLIEQFYYPKLGPGSLYEEMARLFEKMGGTILYNSEVIDINLTGTRIKNVIVKREAETQIIHGDIFISSMPIKDLITNFHPKAPKKISKIAERLPYRDFITVGLLVKKLSLTNKTKKKTLNNIIPDCWIYIQEKGIKMGRLQIFNNWSPYLVKDIENTVWLGLEYFCNESDSFFLDNDFNIKQLATKELIKMGFIIGEDDVLDGCVLRVKKAYPAYFDSYKDIDIIRKYLDTIDNLYCIGRNGQHRYNNMDHSMKTGIVAVDLILNGIKDRASLWNVNTEQEYQEEIKNEKD